MICKKDLKQLKWCQNNYYNYMVKVLTDKFLIEKLLTKGAEEVIVREHLEKKLQAGERLRVKLGIDPTGSVLHLGHAVVLKKLRDFQDLGHQVIFLIGDFTARIGDPSGRSKERVPMSDEQIKKNMKDYVKQAGLILDLSKVEIRYNSEWLDKLSLEEVIKLTSKATYAQIAQRADFKKRIKEDTDLTLQEFMYPIMVGYDSVALKADVELGGADQKFNLLMGRQIQARYDQEPQDIITCPILEGLHGKDKMSKSLNNYIALTEKPDEMYGKIMSIADGLIVHYFSLATDLADNEIKKIASGMKTGKNPRDYKMRLAREVVALYHGAAQAKTAEENFIKQFQQKETPDEVRIKKLEVRSKNIIDLLMACDLAASKGEARRLIEQGGIKIDGAVVKSIAEEVSLTKKGLLLQRGKRQFVRVTGK